jgi:hypothetical protein
MAGIGFELRHLLRKNTLTSLLQAYAYAGVIGSGPWVFSIIGILLVGVFSLSVVAPPLLVTQFQTSVTYLVACSLILTGAAQLMFTRFISDRLFSRRMKPSCPICTACCCWSWQPPAAGHAGPVRGAAGPGPAVPDADAGRLHADVRGLGADRAAVRPQALQGHSALFGVSYAHRAAVAASASLGTGRAAGSFVIGHIVLLAGMWAIVLRAFPIKGAGSPSISRSAR